MYMNTGKEYKEIKQKISKGNIVDGKDEMYSTFRDGSLNRRVKDDSGVEGILFRLNMCIDIEGVCDGY